MNMLYEGLKEKGALMLIPSSAVESRMGMGGLMGAAASRSSSSRRRLCQPPATEGGQVGDESQAGRVVGVDSKGTGVACAEQRLSPCAAV